MHLTIPLPERLALAIADEATDDGDYPTCRLPKGLRLLDDGCSLAGEGVGFGVPILKQGARTVFPGGMELICRGTGPVWEVGAAYTVDLVERLAKSGGEGVRSGTLYAAKDALAALHRRAPRLRGPLTAASGALRRVFGWVTTFAPAGFSAPVEVTFTVNDAEGRVHIELDAAPLAGTGVTEVVLMNEMGARYFDRYRDADGADLRGDRIGTWDEVTAAEASFASSAHHVAFVLGQADGARLWRGRELIGSRVAWSGFGYSFPPSLGRFACDLRIQRTA